MGWTVQTLVTAERHGQKGAIRTLAEFAEAQVVKGLDGRPSGVGRPVFLADAFGCDLHDLLAAYIGQLSQLRYAGDQFVDAYLGSLIGSAVGGAGAGAGNGAAGGENHHIGELLLLLGFFGRNCSWQDKQQGEGARGKCLQCGFHRYCSLDLPGEIYMSRS